MGGNSSDTSTTTTTTRLPKSNDPSVRAAQTRAQDAARKRTGRTSTILSDALRSVVGATGKLGA